MSDQSTDPQPDARRRCSTPSLPDRRVERVPSNLLSIATIEAYLIGRQVSDDFDPATTHVQITIDQLTVINSTDDGLRNLAHTLAHYGYLDFNVWLDRSTHDDD